MPTLYHIIYKQRKTDYKTELRKSILNAHFHCLHKHM